MKIKHLYLLIAIFGSLVPYFHFLNFLSSHGLDSAEFFNQMLEQPISAFFAWDVILSTVAMIVLVFREGRRLNMKALGLYVFFNLTVGVSLALPAFLYAREKALEQQA